MAQRLVYLVVPLLVMACAPDLPRDICADDRFDVNEETDVIASIDEINKTGQELLGRDLVVYRGRHRDADGWHLKDADDGWNVVYKQLEQDANYDYLQTGGAPHDKHGFVAGLGLNHDILVFAFALPYSRTDGQTPGFCVSPFLHAQFEKDNVGGPDDVRVEDWAMTSDDCGAEGYSLYGPTLRTVVLHEMGHFIGLPHVNDPKALMYPVSSGATSFGDTDKKALCCVYECVTDDFNCDLSVRYKPQ